MDYIGCCSKEKVLLHDIFIDLISNKNKYFINMLAEQEMTKQEFREKLQIASGTMTKLNKGQEVSMSIILRICEYFNCNIGDVCDVVKIG